MRTDDALARSQVRWRGDEPDADLTWGVLMSGKPFLDFVSTQLKGHSVQTVVEIGPGYGRITEALLQGDIRFARYFGLELSPQRVAKLRQRFTDPRMQFVEADIVAGAGLDGLRDADLIIGSAVFEHFYPDFGRALDCIARFTSPHGTLVFDLIRHDEALATRSAVFEPAGGAYVRVYSIAQIKRLFRRSSFRMTALGRLSFGMGAHQREVARTVIAAAKTGGTKRTLRSLMTTPLS